MKEGLLIVTRVNMIRPSPTTPSLEINPRFAVAYNNREMPILVKANMIRPSPTTPRPWRLTQGMLGPTTIGDWRMDEKVNMIRRFRISIRLLR